MSLLFLKDHKLGRRNHIATLFVIASEANESVSICGSRSSEVSQMKDTVDMSQVRNSLSPGGRELE